MSGQQDWYLHEGPASPPDAHFVSLGSGGVLYQVCGDPISLDAISIWPSLQVDDYLLVQIVLEDGNVGRSGAPANWDYIYWQLFGASDRGPHCHWCGHFVTAAEIGTDYVFDNSDVGHKVCISAVALRNVDKRVPADFMYNSFQYTSHPNHRGMAVWGTRVHEYGGIQVSCNGGRTGNGALPWYARKYGPTPDLSDWWAPLVSSAGATSIWYANHEVLYDVPLFEKFSEESKTYPVSSISGGAKLWTEYNGSLSWFSRTNVSEYQMCFGGGVGSLTRMYVRDVGTLGPGQYAAFAVMGGSTTDSSYVCIEVTATDEPSLAWSLYGYCSGEPNWKLSGTALGDLGFDQTLLDAPIMSGLPGNGSAWMAGVFSLTSAHVIRLRLRQLGAGGSADSVPNSRADYALGLNPTSMSQLTPYLMPYDFPAITRLHKGRNWSPVRDYQYTWPITFQLQKREARIRRPGMVGEAMPYGTGVGPAERYPTDWRGQSPNQNSAGVSRADRWVFPRYYPTNSAASLTYGHYYWEMQVLGHYDYGYNYDDYFCGLTGPAKGSIYGNAIGGADLVVSCGLNFDVPQDSMTDLIGSLSYTRVYWNDLDVLGFELDYANSFFRVYKNNVRICDYSLTAIGKKVPYAFMATAAAPVSNKYARLSVNFTGPFAYAKPAGSVAYDWVNEQ